jgi:hypothetical protein
MDDIEALITNSYLYTMLSIKSEVILFWRSLYKFDVSFFIVVLTKIVSNTSLIIFFT